MARLSINGAPMKERASLFRRSSRCGNEETWY
jgi:hypothetical protein